MPTLKKLLRLDCHVCPWWLAYAFDNRLRRLWHHPAKILGPYVQEGMTVVDLGCGMGYFSLGLAHLVGAQGSVISVDIQENMLKVLERRAIKARIAHRIHLHRCEPGSLALDQKVDFALSFWMVHEAPDKKDFLRQIAAIVKPGGKYLLVEPKVHVTRARFEGTLADGLQIGFNLLARPPIALSRAALLGKL
ncbi:MAG: class I SAM-dependent methyltransferase [Desulfobacterales bacterium]|nr:MAG: class I SAM-dependent methyltransferase [Desulfobacterales bacterium]